MRKVRFGQESYNNINKIVNLDANRQNINDMAELNKSNSHTHNIISEVENQTENKIISDYNYTNLKTKSLNLNINNNNQNLITGEKYLLNLNNTETNNLRNYNNYKNLVNFSRIKENSFLKLYDATEECNLGIISKNVILISIYENSNKLNKLILQERGNLNRNSRGNNEDYFREEDYFNGVVFSERKNSNNNDFDEISEEGSNSDNEHSARNICRRVDALEDKLNGINELLAKINKNLEKNN